MHQHRYFKNSAAPSPKVVKKIMGQNQSKGKPNKANQHVVNRKAYDDSSNKLKEEQKKLIDENNALEKKEEALQKLIVLCEAVLQISKDYDSYQLEEYNFSSLEGDNGNSAALANLNEEPSPESTKITLPTIFMPKPAILEGQNKIKTTVPDESAKKLVEEFEEHRKAYEILLTDLHRKNRIFCGRNEELKEEIEKLKQTLAGYKVVINNAPHSADLALLQENLDNLFSEKIDPENILKSLKDLFAKYLSSSSTVEEVEHGYSSTYSGSVVNLSALKEATLRQYAKAKPEHREEEPSTEDNSTQNSTPQSFKL